MYGFLVNLLTKKVNILGNQGDVNDVIIFHGNAIEKIAML